MLHALQELHKEGASASKKEQTRVQNLPREKTRVLMENQVLHDYVLFLSGYQRYHKLSSRWKDPIRIIEVKSLLVIEVEYLTGLLQ